MFEQFGRIFLFVGILLTDFLVPQNSSKFVARSKGGPPPKKKQDLQVSSFQRDFYKQDFPSAKVKGKFNRFFFGVFFLKFLRPGPLHLLLLLYTLSLGLTDKGAAPETLNISGAISFE